MTGEVDICPACAQPIAFDDRYCVTCGLRLELPHCHVCGRLMEEASRFCAWCGAPRPGVRLFTSQPFPRVQVRRATVMFCLIDGLPSLLQHLDIEDVKEVVDTCFEQVSTSILFQGGTIDKYMVDSLLAVFGVPVAHEDDPQRAVRAACGMIDAIRRFNEALERRGGHRVGLRIGINTGRVVTGHVGHGDPHLTVMGDVVNTASRMQHAAPLNGILVGEATWKQLGDRFAVFSDARLKVKGKRVPLHVFRVGVPDGRDAVPFVDPPTVPLVGRGREFGLLARTWRSLVRASSVGTQTMQNPPGKGVWIAIWGEAGMGKDRLLDEFLERVLTDPVVPRVVSARGSSWTEGRGYQVLRGIVRGLGESTGRRGLDDARSAVRKVAALGAGVPGGPLPAADAGALRGLTHVCGLPPGEQEDTAACHGWPDLRRRGFRELVSACEVTARHRPLVLVVRDVQWAEEGALDFLEVLGRAVPMNMLLVTSARPSLFLRRPAWEQSSGARIDVTLNPLSRADTGTFARMFEERVGAPLSWSLDELYRFTGGNPLFLTEVLRERSARSGTTAVSDSDERVPATIESVVQSRLDRLPFEEGMTLRAAAVIGSVFWAGAIEALMGSAQTTVLGSLARKRLVRRRTDSTIPGEVEYVFRDAVLASVAKSNLIDVVRKRYHRQIAAWLVEHAPQDGSMDEAIACHWWTGCRFQEAADRFFRCAERAFDRQDVEVSSRLCSRALDALQRTRGVEVGEPRARALALRGECRRRLSDFAGAAADLEEAGSLLETSGMEEEAGYAWYGAALSCAALGDADRAMIARRSAERCLPAPVGSRAGALRCHLQGELALLGVPGTRTMGMLDRSLLRYRRLGDSWSVGRTLEVLGRLHCEQGEPALARTRLTEALTLWDRLGNHRGLAGAAFALGKSSERAARYRDALSSYQRSVWSYQKAQDQDEMAGAWLAFARMGLKCGYLGRARQALQASQAIFMARSRAARAGVAGLAMAELWLAVGAVDCAAPCVARALERLDASGPPCPWHDVGRVLLARCALGRGDIAAATRSLQAVSGRWASDQEWAWVEAAALIVMARVALAQQSPERARTLVDELDWNPCLRDSVEWRAEAALLAAETLSAQGRREAASARYQEAERLASRHDLVPLWWRVLRARAPGRPCSVPEGGRAGEPADGRRGAGLSSRAEVFREFVARIEDEELIRRVRACAGGADLGPSACRV